MGAPQAAGPSWIDFADAVQFFGTQSSGGWMVRIGSALYVFSALHSGSFNTSGVFKSTDGGNTWAQKDSANAPAAEGSVVFDSVGNRFICAVAHPVLPSTAPIFLQDFNFATDTWGVAYATGGPASIGTFQVFKRPDGTIAVFYSTTSPPPGGTTTLRAGVWNGASWISDIDVGVSS